MKTLALILLVAVGQTDAERSPERGDLEWRDIRTLSNCGYVDHGDGTRSKMVVAPWLIVTWSPLAFPMCVELLPEPPPRDSDGNYCPLGVVASDDHCCVRSADRLVITCTGNCPSRWVCRDDHHRLLPVGWHP